MVDDGMMMMMIDRANRKIAAEANLAILAIDRVIVGKGEFGLRVRLDRVSCGVCVCGGRRVQVVD